ncbi:MAG: efflux RND transporter periplasmic adaptor subunit [Spirochaetota bacterium]
MNSNDIFGRGPGRLASAMATVAVASIFLFSCAKAKEETAKPPRAVEATIVQQRTFSLEAEYAARILPASQVTITPKVGGRVASVRATIGDVVAKGQTLFTLETGDYDAQYRQANAALVSSRANLTRSNEAGQESQTLQAQAANDQALLARDEIQKAWDKTKRLRDGGVVSKQQMDDVDAKLRAANIQLEAAKKSLELVRDKAGRQASDVLSGQVDAAQAQADLAKSQLDSTAIVSPLSGRVSWRDVEPGQMVGTSSLTFVVMDDSTVLAEAGLSDRSVGLVRKGMSIAVTINALGGDRVQRSGMVNWVSPAADPRTLLYTVRIAIANSDGAIRPGMLAKIRFPIEAPRQAILIPERAAFSENGLDYVMVAEEGRARKRQVSLGESDGASIEVTKGLEPGNLVITAGQEFLADGDAIASSS